MNIIKEIPEIIAPNIKLDTKPVTFDTFSLIG